MERKAPARSALLLFFLLLALTALANGLSDGVYGNYFKEVYDVTAVQRGFIEFPRELPGLLCMLVIALLSRLGDLRIAFFAQLLALRRADGARGLDAVLCVMLVFLFINSMGMHLFMPLQDAIGMFARRARPDRPPHGAVCQRQKRGRLSRGAAGFWLPHRLF